MSANQYDVVHVVAQVLDTEGRSVRIDEREIVFEVEGDVKVLGIDNGAPANVQDFQSNKIMTAKGRALLAIQSLDTASEVEVIALSEGLEAGKAKVSIR